uniref:Neur_chan_memb domain-containing protein n=1 Tax=Steinernema glaseri TaxID=37863 RepID=A0A1I7YJH3_9BILA
MPSHIAYRLMMVQPSALSCRRRIGQGRESKDFYNDHRVKIPDLSLIHEQLMELVETQRMFRRRLEKEQIKHLVEVEWSRIFSRFDYVFLTVFQVLNLVVLLLFLRFAWSPTPAIREHLV